MSNASSSPTIAAAVNSVGELRKGVDRRTSSAEPCTPAVGATRNTC